MADITLIFNGLLKSHGASDTPSKEARSATYQTVDEFLKEAYRINSHISSLLLYLKSIRQPYLSTAPRPPLSRRQTQQISPTIPAPVPVDHHLTDSDRDSIDSSTALLLRDLSSSIENLSSAETLRQETQASLLRKKFGHALNSRIWKWAAGGDGAAEDDASRSPERAEAEDTEKMIKTVRENVLWLLRRRLEGAAEAQRGMVEKRIERALEKEKSILYKSRSGPQTHAAENVRPEGEWAKSSGPVRMQESDADRQMRADIESKLSPEQLQLFAEENDVMLRHYEDTLGKVQNAEKSLLEISSLQQTLVAHLATQEDYINQLVTDASSTHSNVGRGNQELKRASERKSTAQAVFWGTVGLCTGLILWDAIF